MWRTWCVIVLAAALVTAMALPALAKEVEAKGTVELVTLYRGQALVTRVAPLNEPAGSVQLVITDLPERIRSDSLYASADAGAQVRAVRFRTSVVTEAPRKDVRKLDKPIEDLEKELRKNAQEQRMLAKQEAYLDKLESFVAPTVKVEMAKGVLNAETLKTVTVFVFEQRAKLSQAQLALREKEQESKKRLTELQRERSLLTRTHSRMRRQAVVFLDKARAGRASVRLSYLVDGATWTPAYNLRAKPGKDNVAVEYNAVITQMSGEDWRNVSLTLSTASPTMTADAPILAPLLVALRPRLRASEQLVKVRQQFSDASSLLRRQEQKRQKALDRGGQIEAQWWLNKAAHGFQIWELYVPQPLVRVARTMARQEVSGLSVNYALEGRSNVDSRQDQQMARIANLSLPAKFTNVAIPLLTERVNRRATIQNTSKVALLEGRSSVYLNGEFVGKGTIPMVANGQKFLAGFGIAPQLRTWRELVSKKEKIQGANREVSYEYRLVLDNYGDQEALVQVYDRLPYAQEDIRVTKVDGFTGITKDPEYHRIFKPQGILRWDLAVPKHSAGGTAKTLEYSFNLEYDKNTDITTATGGEREERIRALFEKQLRAF